MTRYVPEAERQGSGAVTRAHLVQWRLFQPPTTRDSSPIVFVLFMATGLALAGAVLVLTIGAWL